MFLDSHESYYADIMQEKVSIAWGAHIIQMTLVVKKTAEKKLYDGDCS